VYILVQRPVLAYLASMGAHFVSATFVEGSPAVAARPTGAPASAPAADGSDASTLATGWTGSAAHAAAPHGDAATHGPDSAPGAPCFRMDGRYALPNDGPLAALVRAAAAGLPSGTAGDTALVFAGVGVTGGSRPALAAMGAASNALLPPLGATTTIRLQPRVSVLRSLTHED
jgi:hypothetical protein